MKCPHCDREIASSESRPTNAAPQVPERGPSNDRTLQTPAVAAPSIADTYKRKIERDAATMKVLRMLLCEAHDFLNAQVVLPEDYEDWEKRYKAFTESLDRLASGVAFVTDTRVGGE